MVFCIIIGVIISKPIGKIILVCLVFENFPKKLFVHVSNIQFFMLFCLELFFNPNPKKKLRLIFFETTVFKLVSRTLSIFPHVSIPCCDIQHFFFLRGSPKLHTQLSKLFILNKLNLKVVFCRIITVIIKPIGKMTQKMLFSVPCCDIQQFFFVAI